MSSIILVNDLFEELREENERLKQTIDLMVKYRKCLIGFRDNCNCDANDCNKLLVQLLEEKWTQLEDNERHQRSQHQPLTNPSQIVVQTDPLDSYHFKDSNPSTTDEITGGHRSNESIVIIDDNSGDEDPDVFPLVRNAIESDGEDVVQEITEELVPHRSVPQYYPLFKHHKSNKTQVIPTADTSKTLRSTTVRTRRSTTQLIDSVSNRKHRLKCGQSGCDRSFMNNMQLIGHMKSVHPELNPYSCSLCPNTYQQSEQLTDHYNSCHSVPNVGQLSAIDEDLVPTADTSKTARTRRSYRVRNRNEWLKCRQSGCDLRFCDHKQLDRHMISAHPECRPYACSLCPNSYQRPIQLRSHYNDSHLEPISGQRLSTIDENRERNRCRLPDGRGYRCHYTDCQQFMTSSWSLTYHMRTHRADYRFGCNECHNRFVNINKLVYHKKWSHNKSNTNVFECHYTDCDYKTIKKQSLEKHYLRHENKRSFKCPINGCKYKANTTDDLHNHKVNIHGFKRRKF